MDASRLNWVGDSVSCFGWQRRRAHMVFFPCFTGSTTNNKIVISWKGFQQSLQSLSFCLNEHFFYGGTNWEVFWVVFTEFIDIFLYMFSLYLMYPQDEMSRDELSQLLPQNRLWKLLIIKIRKFPPFFHFSIIGLPPVSSSTLGSPHPFIHLSIQVVGNDFCWPNFIRGIFLKSTAPQWGETFHNQVGKNQGTNRRPPLLPLWWPMAIVYWC